MKIDINKVKIAAKKNSELFEVCVYGKPSEDILNWAIFHNLKIFESGPYSNIIIPNDLSLDVLFNSSESFEWLDGFSPNLNKKLHIGHFSNLVLGKAFKSLGIADNTVSIYGDTLQTGISKNEALKELTKYQNYFVFYPNLVCMASNVKYNGELLKNGEGKYEGTKIFEIGEEKIVAIKSDGSTSYFYQDVALGTMLNASTLYLTGTEQNNHFNLLKQLFPNIEHVGLGLVKIAGMKMASRLGNVILIEEFIDLMNPIFNNDINLIYNVFAGFILKSSPEVDKSINLDVISNVKNSSGLYLSYTMARLISAGCSKIHINQFKSKDLEFAYFKSKFNLKPNILFTSIVEHCKEINSLYTTHIIKDNKENKLMFEDKLSDLMLGFKKLGLFYIDKV